MNLIPKIAEMLGLKMGEVFRLKYSGGIIDCNYRITEHGVERSVFTNCDWCQGGRMLEAMLAGEVEIIRKREEKCDT